MLLSDEATNAEYIYNRNSGKKNLILSKNEAWKKKLKSKYV
jgi:hypothetical protein